MSEQCIITCSCIESFRSKCIEICKLDPAYFISALALTCQGCFKK